MTPSWSFKANSKAYSNLFDSPLLPFSSSTIKILVIVLVPPGYSKIISFLRSADWHLNSPLACNISYLLVPQIGTRTSSEIGVERDHSAYHKYQQLVRTLKHREMKEFGKENEASKWRRSSILKPNA